MHICMHRYTDRHRYASIRTLIHTHTYIMNTNTHIHKFIRKYKGTLITIYIHTKANIHTNIKTYAQIHTHTNANIHTDIHTYIKNVHTHTQF